MKTSQNKYRRISRYSKHCRTAEPLSIDPWWIQQHSSIGVGNDMLHGSLTSVLVHPAPCPLPTVSAAVRVMMVGQGSTDLPKLIPTARQISRVKKRGIKTPSVHHVYSVVADSNTTSLFFDSTTVRCCEVEADWAKGLSERTARHNHNVGGDTAEFQI